MSDDRTDLSRLTGPELVRAFLDEYDKPRTTPADKAAFFGFKARVFGAIAARNGNPVAAEAAYRASAERDRLLSAPTDAIANGGEF